MYYLLYGFLYLISLLPLKVLYVISDLIYLLVYYIFGYRKKVVLSNLLQAFPNKTEQERIVISKKFYKNFIDSFIESIKLFSTKENFITKHCTGDLSIFNSLYAQGKSLQLHGSHQFNWEIINHYIAMNVDIPLIGVYMPLKNKAIERIFLNLRKRYNTILLPATDMNNKFTPWRNKPNVLVLVADQNPGNPGKSYWFNFFGKPTPFIIGPEKYARQKEIPVVFAKSIKLKRGLYKLDLELVCENAADLPETVLTKKFVDYITETITNQPENWLWSHRRWKWDWNEIYGKIIC